MPCSLVSVLKDCSHWHATTCTGFVRTESMSPRKLGMETEVPICLPFYTVILTTWKWLCYFSCMHNITTKLPSFYGFVCNTSWCVSVPSGLCGNVALSIWQTRPSAIHFPTCHRAPSSSVFRALLEKEQPCPVSDLLINKMQLSAQTTSVKTFIEKLKS